VVSENTHDKNGSTLPSEDMPLEIIESKRSKESKPPSPKTNMPPFPFP